MLKSNDIISFNQFRSILKENKNPVEWYKSLIPFLDEFEINSIERISAFLAQTTYESRDYTVLRENFNYKAETLIKVFSKYFPNIEIANKYVNLNNKQEAIANRIYANRMGNGDEQSGDGWRYSGRGVIQLTGKNNWIRFAKDMNVSFETLPNYLITPIGAINSACWFWNINKCNQFADKEDNEKLTKIINGGLHGLSNRISKYIIIKKILIEK